MIDPTTVMARLDVLATELDMISKELGRTEESLAVIEVVYEEKLGDWEASMWEECQINDTKWPPEKLRLRMAHRAMDAKLLGTYNAEVAKRRRLEKRIAAIKVQTDSQRSILSALKTEMEASR